jgi:hypothetical protein
MNGELMADRSSMRRQFGPLKPDFENTNPYRGLPADLPSFHSRFPIVPSAGYGGLSFLPEVGENTHTEGKKKQLEADERAAWRDAMREAVGDVVDIPAENPTQSGD